MKAGKILEILIKRFLMNVGFSPVNSDGLYVYDAAPGQMIQGLGEAHNADVLLEPPVQTPFYAPSRILVECKDYNRKVGLDVIRSALGLREDINHFEIVDKNELEKRKNTRRTSLTYDFHRYYYQVAVASVSGFTIVAQKFAATHRISLIELNKMPFWDYFCSTLSERGINFGVHGFYINRDSLSDECAESVVKEIADEIGRSMALAVTNSGQLLFLYNETGGKINFSNSYTLHWETTNNLWQLASGNTLYSFQLPETILEVWLSNAHNEMDIRKEAINCKANYFSNMVVYYIDDYLPMMKMISIDRAALNEAKQRLNKEE